MAFLILKISDVNSSFAGGRFCVFAFFLYFNWTDKREGTEHLIIHSSFKKLMKQEYETLMELLHIKLSWEGAKHKGPHHWGDGVG